MSSASESFPNVSLLREGEREGTHETRTERSGSRRSAGLIGEVDDELGGL